MKVLLLLLCAIGLTRGNRKARNGWEFKNALADAIVGDAVDAGDVEEYSQYVERNGKLAKYDVDDKKEMRRRYKLFRQDKEKVRQLNANRRREESHGKVFEEKYGETVFADLDDEEKKARFMDAAELARHEHDNDGEGNPDEGDPPALGFYRRRLFTPATGCSGLASGFFDGIDNQVDSQPNYQFCTAAKDQGQTNGCWSFAATAQFECNYGRHSRAGNAAGKTFSEQYAIDCSTSYHGTKAYGGWPSKLNGMFPTKGMCANYYYAWDSTRDKDNYCYCRESKINGYCYQFDTQNNKAAISKAATSYAWAFAMYVDDAFISLKGADAAFFNCASKKYAHAMTMTGQYYGGYVYVKNSWGTDWGDNGYAWIALDAILGSCKWGTELTMTMSWNFYASGQTSGYAIEAIANKELPAMPAMPAMPALNTFTPSATINLSVFIFGLCVGILLLLVALNMVQYKSSSATRKVHYSKVNNQSDAYDENV